MGDVAASGGYYIASPAEVIVALPATLTGSIGVSGGKLVVDGLLERVGVTTGSVQRGARALMYSPSAGFSRTSGHGSRRPSTPSTTTSWGRWLPDGCPVAEIEAVARGRVWTGRDALEAGLVDELGALRDAVRIARERADLPEDAPVLGAIRIPPLARLSRPKNSEDPRTWVGTAWPGLRDVVSALGLTADATLRMPDITLR